MTKMEIEKLASAAQVEAEKDQDQALDQVDQIEGVLLRRASQTSQSGGDKKLVHTAKAER